MENCNIVTVTRKPLILLALRCYNSCYNLLQSYKVCNKNGVFSTLRADFSELVYIIFFEKWGKMILFENRMYWKQHFSNICSECISDNFLWCITNYVVSNIVIRKIVWEDKYFINCYDNKQSDSNCSHNMSVFVIVLIFTNRKWMRNVGNWLIYVMIFKYKVLWQKKYKKGW